MLKEDAYLDNLDVSESSQLLLRDMLNLDPKLRPSASEILFKFDLIFG